MKLFLLFLLSGMSLCVQAQDLTGIWRGNFRKTPIVANSKALELLGGEDRYKFEVQIDQKNKKFDGVTYSYLTTVFYGKATCKGTIDTRTKKVILEEIKITEVRMVSGNDACVMTLFLQYSKAGDEEFLEGNYISFNTKDSTNCGKGSVFLRKVTTSDFYEEPFLTAKKARKPTTTTTKPTVQKPNNPPVAKVDPGTKPVTKPAQKPATPATKPPVKKPATTTPPPVAKARPDIKPVQIDTARKAEVKPPVRAPGNISVPKVLASRSNELVQTITTSAKEVTVNIYDNGTIDNDTVSVYLDNKLVLSKKRLTEKALTLTVKLDDDSDYHELVMVADNLGEFPPNTSLMVVNAGNKQYEVRISSNEQKNAVVRFKYAP